MRAAMGIVLGCHNEKREEVGKKTKEYIDSLYHHLNPICSSDEQLRSPQVCECIPSHLTQVKQKPNKMQSSSLSYVQTK